jgi:hypothetical protein
MTAFKRRPPAFAVRIGYCFLLDYVIAPVVRKLERSNQILKVLWADSRRRARRSITQNPFRGYTSGEQGDWHESLVPESSACSFEIGQPDVAVRFGHAENDPVAGHREANAGNLLGGHERTSRLMEVIHGERRSDGALARGVQALCPKAAEPSRSERK